MSSSSPGIRRSLKILFVRPAADPETIGLQHVMVVEPLELEVLATVVPAGDRPALADMLLDKRSLRDILASERPDVLCVTGYVTNVADMIGYCRLAKELLPGVATVVGGVHCEVCPDDLDDAAVDFRVVRNAVVVFPALLEHIRGNGPRPPAVFAPGEKVDMDALPPYDFTYPIPDRSLTKPYRRDYFYIFHQPVALVKTAFGCPYKCNFCFCRRVTRGAYHTRPLDQVLQELKGIEESDVYIVDDDFLVSRQAVMRFVEGVRREGIHKRYVVYGRADFVARHPDVMREFRDAGLRTVIIGFESFDDAELASFDKGTDAATNEAAMRVVNDLGLDCYATIILSPEWGRPEFARLGRKLRELGIHYVNLQPLTPLPGTGIEVRADQLVISRKDYAKWDLAHVSVRPKKLTVGDYYGEIIKAYMQTLYQLRAYPRYLQQPPWMIWKMIRGSQRVRKQYLGKQREARRGA